jgi:hypothetical protein
MPRYLISFDDGSMDRIPEEDWPAVGETSHAVVREAKAAGIWIFGGGVDRGARWWACSLTNQQSKDRLSARWRVRLHCWMAHSTGSALRQRQLAKRCQVRGQRLNLGVA